MSRVIIPDPEIVKKATRAVLQGKVSDSDLQKLLNLPSAEAVSAPIRAKGSIWGEKLPKKEKRHMHPQYPAGSRGTGLIASLLLAQLSLGSAAWAQPASCPNPPPVTISPQLPADVCIPPGAPGVPFQFFDDFSWRSFIALIWPAQTGQRGVPDPKQTPGSGAGPLVFETFKADWEIFQPNGAAPSAWSSFAGANPCNLPYVGFNDLILGSFSKFGDLGQAGFGNLVGPLVAQNQTYTRFHTGFNQVEFNQILNNGWYLQKNLVPPIVFQPDNSENNPIDFKASWMDMTNVKNPQQFYTRTAWVLDPSTGTCSQKTVGLVGLHIVTKTPSRPQWIWSSFEHVDNVPGPGATAPYAYNDGSSTAQPTSNPYGFPPPATAPQPFNVQRLIPISASTQATNAAYQKALASQGNGVWQNYQLVMTQWPIQANVPANPGTPSFTFPGTGANTAFANTTMETFDQTNIRTGCMNCHTQAQSSADFLWSLTLNAFPSKLGTPPSQPQLHVPFRAAADPQLQELKKLMGLPQAPAQPAPVPKQKK